MLNVVAGKPPNHFFLFFTFLPMLRESLSSSFISLVCFTGFSLGHLKTGNNFFVLYLDYGDITRWCNGGEHGDHLIFQTKLTICGDSFSRLCSESFPLKYSPSWARMWHLFEVFSAENLVVPVLALDFRRSLEGIFQGLSLSFSWFFSQSTGQRQGRWIILG